MIKYPRDPIQSTFVMPTLLKTIESHFWGVLNSETATPMAIFGLGGQQPAVPPQLFTGRRQKEPGEEDDVDLACLQTLITTVCYRHLLPFVPVVVGLVVRIVVVIVVIVIVIVVIVIVIVIIIIIIHHHPSSSIIIHHHHHHHHPQ